jgi:hypothetical protein
LSDEQVRLRYTGDQATTFTGHGIGEVEPGGTFDAPVMALLSLMRRADVEHDGECPQPPCRCGVEAAARAASEDASASQEGETTGGRRSSGRSRSGSPTGKNGTGEQ